MILIFFKCSEVTHHTAVFYNSFYAHLGQEQTTLYYLQTHTNSCNRILLLDSEDCVIPIQHLNLGAANITVISIAPPSIDTTE